MPPVTKEVVVYETEDEYRVYPGSEVLDAGNGDKLMVTNQTDEELIFFASAEAFDNTNKPTLELVPANDSVTTKAAKSRGPGKKRVFTYQVIAPKSGKKAQGNSDPIIIIEN